MERKIFIKRWPLLVVGCATWNYPIKALRHLMVAPRHLMIAQRHLMIAPRHLMIAPRNLTIARHHPKIVDNENFLGASPLPE